MSEYNYRVDTACSNDGAFPPATAKCLTVGIQGPEEYVVILVSSRYTAPDVHEAAEIAVDLFAEHDEIPWTTFGSPFYHVDVWPAAEPDDRNKLSGTVRLMGNDWTWTPNPEATYEGE